MRKNEDRQARQARQATRRASVVAIPLQAPGNRAGLIMIIIALKAVAVLRLDGIDAKPNPSAQLSQAKDQLPRGFQCS